LPRGAEPPRVAQRALARAQDALLDSRTEEAASLIDALLRAQPDNYRAWILRSVISERAGNPVAAMIAINQARLHYSCVAAARPEH
jgi:Flp pilus assembly protein TadD